MVLFPTGGLGRFLLFIIIISTISYLTLNIVSFAGNRWIQYVDVPVRFGLWRVCDTTIAGLCNAWADPFVSSITDILFNSSKPGSLLFHSKLFSKKIFFLKRFYSKFSSLRNHIIDILCDRCFVHNNWSIKSSCLSL